MDWKATLKEIQPAERRQERDAQKRLRELERQTKEQEKLSALEQARLEVETFESGLEVLLTIHKEQGQSWDWFEVATSLPPYPPRKLPRLEVKARMSVPQSSIEAACAQDERGFQEELKVHAAETIEWMQLKNLARQILDGEEKAYTNALVELSGLTELSDLGSSIHFTVHNQKLIECRLKVNGQQAVPAELKTLTTTGKLSVKTIPKARFHEIYQDYVCSCMLRVAREVFAILPVKDVLVTAFIDAVDSRTGQTVERPVLSVAIRREEIEKLDFERLDPSDAVERFLHRGDAKASRKSGDFGTVTVLTPSDLPQTYSENLDFNELLTIVRQLRDQLRAELEKLKPQSAITTSSSSPL